MYVQVDDDVDLKETNLAQLPPPREMQAKTTNLDRYFKWQLNGELSQPGVRLVKVKRADVTHIRSHEDLGLAIDDLIDISGRANDKHVIASYV